MDVEHLRAVLEVGGLAGFTSGMEAADRNVAGVRGQLDKLSAVSKIATDALERVRMTTAQAAETSAVAESMKRSVSGVTDTAMRAADHLEKVKLGQTQAAETKAAAEEQVRSLKEVERQAIVTREAVRHSGGGGGGGPGLFGVGRGLLLPAAIGLGAAVLPAMGPSVLGLGAMLPALGATGVGALGTGMLAFNGVGKAIGGDLKAYKALTSEQQQFVRSVRSLDGELDKLSQVAAKATFPGLTKALHETLTPQFLGAVTATLQSFGSAIGRAGEMLGRYFGSTGFAKQFGPLMHAAAGGITDLIRVFIPLSDALMRVGNAAVPLTQWFGDVVVKGAQAFDRLVAGAQATGRLAGAMQMAKDSLVAVGQLVAGLSRLLGALGAALYPVSRVALKGLTAGLDYLAGAVNRNRDAIRSMVGGALSALAGALHALGPLLGGAGEALRVLFNVARLAATGITVLLRGFEALFQDKGRMITAILAVGTAISLALGPTSAVIVGAVAAVGYLYEHWSGFTSWLSSAFVGVANNVAKAFSVMVNTIVDALNAITSAYNKVAGWLTGNIPGIGHVHFSVGGGGGVSYGASQLADLGQKIAAMQGRSPSAASGAATAALPAASGSPFGSLPAWTSNLGSTKTVTPGTLPGRLQLMLANAQATKGTADDRRALHAILANLRGQLHKATTDLAKAQIQGDINNYTQQLQSLAKQPKIITGDALLTAGLRRSLARVTAQGAADQDLASVLTGSVAADYAKTILSDLKGQGQDLTHELRYLRSKLAGSSGKQRTAIEQEISKIQQSLSNVQGQIISNLQQTVSTLQQRLSTTFSAVQQQLDTALGNLYYQNGLQTPSEALLAQMRQQDQVNSLNDAITQAQQRLAKDKAGAIVKHVLDIATGAISDVVNPSSAATLAADNAAVAAAKRQLAEYKLSVKAAKERSDADKAYADQVAKLNRKLALLEVSFENGTGSMDALRKLAAQFGIQISATNVPDFVNLSTVTGELNKAFTDLIKTIARITGKTPTSPGSPTSPAAKPSSAAAAAAKAAAATSKAKAAAKIPTVTVGASTYTRLASGTLALVSGSAHDAQQLGAALHQPIAMRDGGAGYVPPGQTAVFVSRGDEEFSFSGEGRRFAGGGGLVWTGDVIVHGNVLSEKDLTDAVYTGLLKKLKRNPSLSLT